MALHESDDPLGDEILLSDEAAAHTVEHDGEVAGLVEQWGVTEAEALSMLALVEAEDDDLGGPGIAADGDLV